MTQGKGGSGKGIRPCAHLSTGSNFHHLEELPSPTPVRSINSTDLETLRRIMAQLDTPTSSSTSFAHAGSVANFISALHANSQQPWIIYSRTSDHMNGLSTIFPLIILDQGNIRLELLMALFLQFLEKVSLMSLTLCLFLFFMFLTFQKIFFLLVALHVILTVV